MSLFITHLENARDSLKANRMRTFLTITGVTIGIASIVAILSLATGASQIVSQQVDEVGGNIAIIRPGASQDNSFKGIVNQQAHGAIGASSLTQNDILRIKAIDSISGIAPVMLASASLRGDNAVESTIVGTTPDLLRISRIPLSDGGFTGTEAGLITIGSQLSINLFGTEDSLGKTITVKGKEFRVGGIIARQQNPMNFNGIDFNSVAIVAPNQLIALSPNAQIQQITLQTDSVAHLDRTVIEANKLLLEQHGSEQDFRILTGNQIAEPTGQLFFAIAGVTTAIAAISLFVGGIGIMNIMLVNVAERTREIGIRKALGASHSDIVWQFLIESIIMALAGGIIGSLLGMFFAFCISLLLTFDPVVTWQTIVTALVTSGVVGVVFGLYPALRAAHKSPIDSLNQHS